MPEPLADAEVFIEMLSRHDQSLSSYVMSLVPCSSDAQDILQETKLALWRSFDQYQHGTDFRAWARKAALNRVLDYRRRKAREGDRLWFTDRCYELLSEEFEKDPHLRSERLDQLRRCIKKLQPRHQQILVMRYFRDSTVEDVAAKVDRTVEATYRVLSRIRLALRKCMTESTAS
ncbi:RNA polymerase subunit sigma [Planctomycetales bacterium 10988]|nr:RNA polymerase subunit sigma [Planctomycetales bacterium 10988]